MVVFPPSNQNQVTVLCISQTRVLQELTDCAPSAGATSNTRISGIGHVAHVSGHAPGSELSYTRNRTTRTVPGTFCSCVHLYYLRYSEYEFNYKFQRPVNATQYYFG